MNHSPFHYMTISELSQNIRDGKLSPVELTAHCLERIESLDESLNAFRMVCRERAMGEARAMEAALRAGQDLGPLQGIPYAAKDLFDVRGIPTSAGTRLLENNIATEDAVAIRKLAQTGMIFLGKTNTVQLAYSGIGINHDHGTPKNPWHNTPHVPGGSSSGSAVAVAAGMVPMALGSDTGGSVRIPAALCGITGLKTTVGRIGRTGVYPLSGSMDSVGPMTRSVEDAALVYNVLQGIDFKDDSTWNVSVHDVLNGLNRGVRGLRLAFAERVFWDDVDSEIEKAVRECGNVFQNLGAYVDSIDLPEAEAAWQLNRRGMIIVAEAYTNNQQLLDEHYEKLDPIVAARMIKGKDALASDYLLNRMEWKRLRAEALETLKDIDALLVPTTRIPALQVDEIDADMDTYTARNLDYLRNTSIGNILNLCGLSIPCGFTNKGSPVGLMIYGKPFQEETVLRVGHAFQQVTQWHRSTPDLSWAQQE
ncbi:MAG: amidase [Deltaproteobacteria bacterium]|nr:amidase [Deltaproteobacteria bacterium]MBW1963220.1 amidase [Deltaproteobacteria bacterium]MBW1993349.1 amidase [Deltaproteobacteria bacterium]MBW2150249.1 amidase [Deltaproteobacteria bacterium]